MGRDFQEPVSFSWNKWNVILAVDVFYDQLMSNKILRYFRSHADAGKLVLIGDPARPIFLIENRKTRTTYNPNPNSPRTACKIWHRDLENNSFLLSYFAFS